MIIWGVSLALPAVASAGVIQDWNDVARALVRAGLPPVPMAARHYAILNVAMFEAINDASGRPFQGLQLARPNARDNALRSPGSATQADPEVAASAAASMVLGALFADVISRVPALKARIAALQAPGPGEPAARAAALALGQRAGERVLALRADDNSQETPPPFYGSDEPGQWRPTPPAKFPALLPFWGKVTPWVMASGSQFRPPGPPAITSYVWVDQFNALKSVGSATGASNTPERREIALFWSDEPGTETPAGHWLHIAADIAQTRQLNLVQAARLLALVSVAQADAVILAWDAKYWFTTWRPITAIRDPSGANPRVVADPEWTPLLITPPFPEYISGHSTMSAAATRLMGLFFGTDHIAFDATTDAAELRGVTHHFDRLSDASEEAGLSRIYGGIHFYFSHTDGTASGQRLAEFVFATAFKPAR